MRHDGRLTNAVDLDRQEHRDISVTELACQSNRFRCAPAVAVDDDSCLPLLVCRERSVAIRIQPLQYLTMRSFPLVVSIQLDRNVEGMPAPNLFRQLRLGCQASSRFTKPPTKPMTISRPR
jgi:hypothetical protein